MEKVLEQELNKQIAEFYESEGTAFGHTRHHVWELMLNFMSRLKSGGMLIDVGAGNARLLDVVPEGVKYFGIEPSSSLREFAKRRLMNRRDAQMKAGGFPCLDLPDDAADAVTCIAVLHHIPSAQARREAVKELHRILKPEGMMILSVWNLRAIRFWSWKIFKHVWIRIHEFDGADPGDLYYAWKAGGKTKQRYVHAFTLKEFKSLFSPEDWNIERIAAYDKAGWQHWLTGRNLVAIVMKK